MGAQSWIDLAQDDETGIETIRAYFQGHAYDPHWHDSYLIGFTEQGVQRFNCRRQLHSSVSGQVFLLEPGELHDGHAPEPEGFTYSTMYLDAQWIDREMRGLFEQAPADCLPGFSSTLATEPRLLSAVVQAFSALHQREMRMFRQTALDGLLASLSEQAHWRRRLQPDPRLPLVAQRARDYLHAHHCRDIGLDELATVCGVDRFRLSRAFKAAFGIAPHAYLVQLRLARARHLLARGEPAVQVAAVLGFADQSHLGRWFRRAYGITPALYQRRCSNLPDRQGR